MADSAGKKMGRLVVWVVLALLIVALAGFGITGFGGSATAVATVGERDVTAQDYFRSLSNAIRAEQAARGRALGRAEAEAIGLPQLVQGQLITQAALDDETARLGISVGDETVGAQIVAEGSFAGPTGEFDRENYEFILRQSGWSVREFEEDVREETARTLLQGAVAGGTAVPDPMITTLIDFFGLRRSLEWQRFGPEALDAPIPDPSAADISAQYEATPEAYTLPEAKRITYAILRPEMLATTLEPDPEAIAERYGERIDEFVQPERRLVERLVFEDQAAAEAAAAALEAGETSFSELVTARNLSLADIDLGDVSEADLGSAGAVIFAMEEPGITGPHDSTFGPAIFRMNGILNARNVPLEEVRDEIAAELTVERARRMLEDMVPDLDDRLAAGATLEDLGQETDMELGQVDYFAGVDAEIAGYEGFREAAEAVTEDDFPEIQQLEDGALFALRLDEIVPPQVQPLSEIEATVAEDWRAAEAERRLSDLAERARAQLAVGAGLGDATDTGGSPVESVEGITRDAFLGGTPPDMVRRAFELGQGESAIVAGEGAVFVVQVTEIAPPDITDPQIAILRQALEAQISQGLAGDVLQLYAQALMAEKGISFNQTGLNAVHTQVFN